MHADSPSYHHSPSYHQGSRRHAQGVRVAISKIELASALRSLATEQLQETIVPLCRERAALLAYLRRHRATPEETERLAPRHVQVRSLASALEPTSGEDDEEGLSPDPGTDPMVAFRFMFCPVWLAKLEGFLATGLGSRRLLPASVEELMTPSVAHISDVHARLTWWFEWEKGCYARACAWTPSTTSLPPLASDEQDHLPVRSDDHPFYLQIKASLARLRAQAKHLEQCCKT